MILLARALMERGFAMRPRERRETSEQDLFRSRLDQIIDMKRALVKLGRAIDWRFLEDAFRAVYTDQPGQPPLPTLLIAGVGDPQPAQGTALRPSATVVTPTPRLAQANDVARPCHPLHRAAHRQE